MTVDLDYCMEGGLLTAGQNAHPSPRHLFVALCERSAKRAIDDGLSPAHLLHNHVGLFFGESLKIR